MFIRFRQYSSHRLQVSIVHGRRVDGRVRHEHIAGLGSIETPPSVADRVAFWKGTHERLTTTRSLHARIPMPTTDEQRALQRENIEADEKFWAGLHDMHAGTVEDHKGLAATVESAIASGQAEMVKAAEARDDARARRERLDRGEDVAGGLGKKLTRADIIKALGWSPSEVRHAERLASLDEREFEEWLQDRSRLADDRIDRKLLRAFLRRRDEKLF
jgi:hypothetical protein